MSKAFYSSAAFVPTKFSMLYVLRFIPSSSPIDFERSRLPLHAFLVQSLLELSTAIPVAWLFEGVWLSFLHLPNLGSLLICCLGDPQLLFFTFSLRSTASSSTSSNEVSSHFQSLSLGPPPFPPSPRHLKIPTELQTHPKKSPYS